MSTHNYSSYHHPSHRRAPTTLEKALDINLDLKYYGSFAEIGAGQEVARQFFQAGRASQTVALTISAYDMTFSDQIYGKEKSGRYVCLPRLEKMLDREFNKLTDRLSEQRGAKTCFFSFADTVATGSEGTNRNCHGWVGVRFQTKPKGPCQQITVHIRMLDKHRLQQQETLSKFGVNLLHSAFYKRHSPEEFLVGLFDQIKEGSISVDAVFFTGDEFKNFNQLLFNLNLLEKGWAEAIYLDETGQLQNPGDALWGKSLLIQRGFYNPVTNTHLDIYSRGMNHFKKEFSQKNKALTNVLGVFEFTLDNLLKKTQLTSEQAYQRCQMITQLGIPVLITKFTYFYKLKEFLRRLTTEPLGIVIGASHLEKLFSENFYSDLDGGLLEGMGKLLDIKTRLYIYPHKTSEICLLTKSFFPPKEVQHIYHHFIENKQIQDIAGCEELSEMIHSNHVLELIKKKNSSWKKLVPAKIQRLVEKNYL